MTTYLIELKRAYVKIKTTFVGHICTGFELGKKVCKSSFLGYL